MNETEWILKVQEEVKRRLGTTYDVDSGNLRNMAGFYMQGLILSGSPCLGELLRKDGRKSGGLDCCAFLQRTIF